MFSLWLHLEYFTMCLLPICASCKASYQQCLMWQWWCCSEGLLGAVWGINNPQNSDSLSMANEAPAAVDHADSDAMSVEPLSPTVSNAAVPEDVLQAPQTPSPDLVNTSCLTSKQQTYSLDEEKTFCAIMQPAGLALRNPHLPQPVQSSAAASLSTSARSASAANTDSGSAPTASVPAAISQPSANSGSTMPAAFRAAASPPTPYARGPAMPSRQPAPLARSPAMPSRHATPASTGAVHGQQASRRPGPAHCDADELWASWHWGNGALHGASAPNMAQCAPQPPHAPKKR